MTNRIRDFDWSKTPLGPYSEWPIELKHAIGAALDGRALALDAHRFLSELGDALRPLLDADEIVAVASRRLGEKLGLDRVVYCDIDVPGDHAAAYRDWNAPGVPSIVGATTLTCLGHALVSHMTAGRPVVISDLRTDPLTANEPLFQELDFRAQICWPLIKGGRWVSAFAAQTRTPREWRPAEVAMVGEVADRTWDAIARAHAEIARRASEERYRTLFASIHEGFCVCEVIADDAGEPCDYRLLEVNPAFTALTGLECGQGRTMRELVPDLDAAWQQMFARVARTGDPLHVVRRSQDGKRWLAARAMRLGDSHPIRIAILVNNVTDRQFADGLLRAEKAVLEQIAAGAPLSDTLATLCGQVESLSLDGIRCSISPADADACGLARSGEPAALTANLIVSRNGQHLGTLAVHHREPHELGRHDRRLIEHATRLAALAIDHTLVQHAVRESERRFRGFADTAPAMLAVTEPDGSCSFVSRGWYEFTGQTPSTPLGFGWLDAVHPDDRDVWRDAFLVANARRAPLAVEHRVRRADGEYRWVSAIGRPRFGPGCEFLGYIGSLIDITDRKHVEEALMQANRHKDEFLATLAHELRNPLAPISNALTLLGLGERDPEANERTREMMERQVQKLVRLIDDLLDTSRISRGTLELRREPVELASILLDALEMSSPVAKDSSRELHVSLPPEPIHLDADPIRLAQVFSNLLDNACKFTGPGGRIRLTAERQGDEAVVSVKDTGIGIPADALESIFELFTQLDRSLERSQSGLGIGLTLVKRIMELHGGSVAAYSNGRGKGSEFVVRIPLIEQHVALPPATSHPETSSVARLRILVVDDNCDAANVLAEVLAESGNEVHTANGGATAIELAARLRPDVILLDIGMPKLNGYDTCRRIRAGAGGREIAIFALTGWGKPQDRRESEEAGFDGHFVKPVNDGALLKVIGERIARRNPPSRAS
jgi:PAS domain S-box-containing protein